PVEGFDTVARSEPEARIAIFRVTADNHRKAFSSLVLIHEESARFAANRQQTPADKLESKRAEIGNAKIGDVEPFAEPRRQMRLFIGKHLDRMPHFAGIDKISRLSLL